MKIEHICKPCKRTAVVTCISNLKGLGPGHTAVVVDGFVYTFERVLSGWFNVEKSGWLKIGTADYFKQNTARPVVIQELATSVNASLVFEYISLQDYDDADYGTSGVCSQEAIRAIRKGTKNPVSTDWASVDTPYVVAKAMRTAGLVQATYYLWPAETAPQGGSIVDQILNRAEIQLMTLAMQVHFPGVGRTNGPAVLNWH